MYGKVSNVEHCYAILITKLKRGRRGRDPMVIRFTTTCAISALLVDENGVHGDSHRLVASH
jgi:hypothetical protein